ncbi:GNAT family N-acetyltransferase [Nesterenkonia populi]|uniref:GNAT family N-acetyltransferase n=1 Tax=Nesterenkonia populi TaxID=1591087 RepID=UPI0011BE5728|nr:GNAT family protein [Nesterenkonia populi]
MAAQFQVRTDDPSQTLEEIWPAFGLRIESPRLVLRVLREADFPQYLAAASSGVTHTEQNPFSAPWNEKPPAEMARNSLPFIWSTRGLVTAEHWHLPLGVFLKDGDTEGPVIGMQDVFAKDWAVLRTVGSGSWLRADHHGHGYGTEMRAMMLAWVFDHFGAEYAESDAYEWNTASRRVSEKLGYTPCGSRRAPDAHRRSAEQLDLFRLSPEDFQKPEWPVEVEGSDRLRAFLESGGA